MRSQCYIQHRVLITKAEDRKTLCIVLHSNIMIRRVFSKLRSSPINNKVFSRAFSSETITVDVGDAYTTHCKLFYLKF